jgi:potassium efflux system protein
LYVIGVGVHLGLAVIAIVGFTYAASRLGQQVLATELLFVCLLLIGSLVTQWTRLNARRMSLRQTAQRRPAEATATAAAEQAAELGMPQADTGDAWFVEPKMSDGKMRSLITTLLVMGGLIGLWYTWVDVIPALTFINEITIWDTEVAVTGTVSGDQPDDAVAREVPKFVPVTLGDVLMATFILLSTFVIARYIGGLFELPVLERLPLDSALRNTITTVTRYALWIVAVIVAAGCLGISWGKVQWMVAALSLGLGFGLQEIFANFISGLIILFERPMRVGDVITIGDTTGVVQAIRMRATTITDWDRKELVVPNKEFATGRLLNWTLTNRTNRRVIEVGVEYGTDPDLARDLLLKVARESPRVLDTPKPIALFEKFADSVLVFSLRVYHPKISDRLRGLHELNTAIQREFNKAGIKFAFPQRDLHLRTPMPPISWFGPEEEGDAEQDDADAQP